MKKELEAFWWRIFFFFTQRPPESSCRHSFPVKNETVLSLVFRKQHCCPDHQQKRWKTPEPLDETEMIRPGKRVRQLLCELTAHRKHPHLYRKICMDWYSRRLINDLCRMWAGLQFVSWLQQKVVLRQMSTNTHWSLPTDDLRGISSNTELPARSLRNQ